MAIKLIALDMDGTLLTDKKEMTDRTIQVLTHAANLGIEIVPATGRSKSGIQGQIRQLPFIRYAITLNGAVVLDLETGEEIHRCTYQPEEALEVWDFIQQFDALKDVYINGISRMESDLYVKIPEYVKDPSVQKLLYEIRVETRDVRSYLMKKENKAEKISMFFPDEKERDRAIADCRKFDFATATSSLPQNLELNRAGAHKGRGLEALMDYLGLKSGEVMACGDGGNDITMIKTAGFGVAMGNAMPEVKSAADWVTLSNEEDGVAYAVEKWAIPS